MSRWEERALEVVYDLPDREEHRRLLVSSCWHGRGFGFTNHLARALKPDLILCLGDLSGLWKPIEACWIQAAWDTPPGFPILFVPGNHDSEYACRVMANKGAHVLESPRIVELGGVRIWGYRNPFRSTWGGLPYDDKLVAQVGKATLLPTGEGPYMVAVHDAQQVKNPPPEVGLIVCGHAHVPKITTGYRTIARTGTAGGGGLQAPRKITPRQAMVVDVKLPEHAAARVWFVESEGKSVSVTDALIRE